MKSRITIEVDFDMNQPFLKVQFVESEDVRDKLLKAFIERLEHTSMFFQTYQINPSKNNGAYQLDFQIWAVSPKELDGLTEKISLMKRLNTPVENAEVAKEENPNPHFKRVHLP